MVCIRLFHQNSRGRVNGALHGQALDLLDRVAHTSIPLLPYTRLQSENTTTRCLNHDYRRHEAVDRFFMYPYMSCLLQAFQTKVPMGTSRVAGIRVRLRLVLLLHGAVKRVTKWPTTFFRCMVPMQVFSARTIPHKVPMGTRRVAGDSVRPRG